DTFDKVLQLLPLTSMGGAWLSCLHEPILHTQFIDFIEAVPDCYRDRISFTTSLSKRLEGNVLERLANSGVYQIRESLDTRQPELFAELRKKGKYEIFEQNLLGLSGALRASERRPFLHFITVVFKDNYGEIVDLVRLGKKLGADSHEIRYVYYAPHLAR